MIAIALILSAVFIPVAFMGGITGRLYQQFALTIAISVLLSAFNALTLSPALSALLLKPATGKQVIPDTVLQRLQPRVRLVDGPLRELRRHPGSKDGPQPRLHRHPGATRTCHAGPADPGGFVPEEDQGYLLVNASTARCASLERTDAVMQEGRSDPGEERGVEGFNTITGYSLLTGAGLLEHGLSSSCSSNRGRSAPPRSACQRRGRGARTARSRRASRKRAWWPSVPRHSGPWHGGWLHDGAPGPQRCERRITWRSRPRASWRPPESVRRSPESTPLLPRHGAADLRRHRPRARSCKSGVPVERRQYDPRGAARQLLRQRLQPLWPRRTRSICRPSRSSARIRSSSGSST